MNSIAIVNGPNLNLIGLREPEIYGTKSLNDCLQSLAEKYKEQVSLIYYQSNVEGEIINFLQDCQGKTEGIILNAGAYTHTSIAIADAVASIKIPTIEVHISNIHAREEFRHHSYLTSRCKGMICGLGLKGYELAIRYFLN